MPKGAGDKKKREKQKINNPRGSKRGGRKANQPGKGKILEKTTDHITTLHLRFHHLKDSKKKCDSSKCKFRGKIYESVGKIPFIQAQSKYEQQ